MPWHSFTGTLRLRIVLLYDPWDILWNTVRPASSMPSQATATDR
ncbi:hypothetical protein AB0G73_36125 [Streptomyces sp. NPDC020719]